MRTALLWILTVVNGVLWSTPPLAIHTGWNLRRPATGAAGKLARWSGSMLPFLADEAARLAAEDPRPSLAARCGRRPKRSRIRGLLLARDVPSIIVAGLRRFDHLLVHRPTDPRCLYSPAGR